MEKSDEQQIQLLMFKLANRSDAARQLTKDILNFVVKVEDDRDEKVAQLQGCQTEIISLQKKVDSLEEENETLRATVFKLQPVDVISDAQLGEKYEHLCNDIADLVETEFSNVENMLGCIEQASEDGTYLLQMKQFLDPGIYEMMRSNSSAQLTFLACLVHRFIHNCIMSKYAFGLAGNVSDLLLGVENEMVKQNGSKNAETIAAWRAQTLQALLHDPKSAQMRLKHCDRVTNRLIKLLQPLFSNQAAADRAFKKFQTRIVTAASELAVMLRASPVDYDFMPGFVAYQRTEARPLSENNSGEFKMVDVRTERPIRSTTPVYARPDGQVGRILCTVHPALVRLVTDDRLVVVTKATVLVSLHEPPTVSTRGSVWRIVTDFLG